MALEADITDMMLQLALAADTVFGENLFSPRARPTGTETMPIGMFRPAKARKENTAGRNGPVLFTCKGAFPFVGRLRAAAQAGDAAAAALDAALGIAQRQLEVAIVNAVPLRRLIQAFDTLEVDTNVKREGEWYLGEVILVFHLEYLQDYDDFAQVVTDQITQIATYVDLVNVFSPSDDVSNPDEVTLFPGVALPAPRTSGPDGRPEAVLYFADPSELDFEDPLNSGLMPVV